MFNAFATAPVTSQLSGNYNSSTATVDNLARLRRVDNVARLLDSRFRVPLTNIRVGLDGILGLIPGVGDVASMAISSYLIHEAYQAGVSKRVLARMMFNLGVDGLVGAVPVVGDVFDVIYKANAKNARLLRKELERRGEIAP